MHVTVYGPALLRLTFKDGAVARLPHVEWFRRLPAEAAVEVKTYGNEPQMNRNVLKCEVFSDTCEWCI